jgi:hypothetical protein
VNATIITLVPKKLIPSTMGDYRPISCCNLIYKCVTKILANSLVPCLDGIISSNQTAFNRSISENILLAQELLRDYHKKGGKAQCTLKVDLMKAYDSINWDFVLHCLACFGIPAEFINWVRVCIILGSQWLLKVPYKVFLKGRRVLGEESPLSPYLVVIVMEILDS